MNSDKIIKNTIRNIIFDFGGVIINIDHSLPIKEFVRLGFPDPELVGTDGFQENLIHPFETGHMSAQEFRKRMRSYLKNHVTDQMIDDAWNTILLDIPPSRVELIRSLKANYRLFLLSNTNLIHYERYSKDFRKEHDTPLESLFERSYWSFRSGIRKPDPEFYRVVITDNRLKYGETLFIDDTEENIESARAAGLPAFHLKPGTEITDLFIEGKLRNDLLTDS